MDSQKISISVPAFLEHITVASSQESGSHAGDSANDDETASTVAAAVVLEFLQAEASAGGPDENGPTVAEKALALCISGIYVCNFSHICRVIGLSFAIFDMFYPWL